MAKELKNILSSLLHNKHDWRLTLLKQWDEIIGDLKDKVQLETIKGDTVVLGVCDACWMQELYMLSPVLIHMINQKLDRPRVKHLRFKRAGIRNRKTKGRRMDNGQKPTITTVQVNSAEQKALDAVNDPQLSRVLKSFLIRCYQEKE